MTATAATDADFRPWTEEPSPNAGRKRIRARIGGLHCSLCTGTIERALGRMPGVVSVAVSLTHEQVAGRVGKSRSAVTNTLRLMSLPPSIQHLLADGRLSAGHAKALLGTPDRAFQEQLARRAVTEGWSVRLLEDAVKDRGGATATEPAGEEADAASGKVTDGAGLTGRTRLRPPGLLELEELLAEYLSTRVNVSMGASKGKVVIEFADLEDLERIYHRMTTQGGHEGE